MTGFCKMKKSFGQVSVEYLIIMGFVAVISVPLILFYFKYTSDSTFEIASSQIYNVARKIADSAESVYFLGSPSQKTIKVYIPSHVTGASLDNREVLFNISTGTVTSQIIQVSSVDLIGELPITQGSYLITLKARDANVEISYR